MRERLNEIARDHCYYHFFTNECTFVFPTVSLKLLAQNLILILARSIINYHNKKNSIKKESRWKVQKKEDYDKETNLNHLTTRIQSSECFPSLAWVSIKQRLQSEGPQGPHNKSQRSACSRSAAGWAPGAWGDFCPFVDEVIKNQEM